LNKEEGAMNRYFKLVFSSLLVYLILILSFSCNKQTKTWQGTIEEIDGIPVVKNPKEPIYSKDVFNLKEDLVIKNVEGKEEFMFQNILFLDVDKEENIYVSDSKAAHIKVFDKNGDFLRTIARRGQGPGEIMRPKEILVFPQGELLVNDTRQARICYFSLNGKFLRQFSTSQLPNWRWPRVDAYGNMVAGFVIPGDEMKTGLKKFAPDLTTIFTITTQPIVSDPAVAVDYFEMSRNTNLVWDVTARDDIIYGTMNKYEIFVHNPKGERIRKIVRECDEIEITKEDEEKLIRGYYGDNPPPTIKNWLKFPKNYPAFSRFTCDEEGRIFVQTYEISETGESCYDVFDAEGKYIVRISLKYRPQVWKKGKMYAIEEDEAGYQIVKRYKVTWII
jgi:hypothetical protein